MAQCGPRVIIEYIVAAVIAGHEVRAAAVIVPPTPCAAVAACRARWLAVVVGAMSATAPAALLRTVGTVVGSSAVRAPVTSSCTCNS